MRVLLIGAGGHAQVVADILLAMNQGGNKLIPIGFLDDDAHLVGLRFLDLPILGTISDLPVVSHDALIVAIGHNRVRQAIWSTLSEQGETFATAVHPAGVIGRDAKVGSGTMICGGVVINPGSRIGQNVILNTGATIDHHNLIGDHAHLAPGVHTGGEVRIGEGALIGIGATVMPGISVGEWAVVGAGAVVTSDVPPFATVIGVPARLVRLERSMNRHD